MLSSATSQRATLLAAPEEGRIIARSACARWLSSALLATTILGLASFWFWILVQRTPFWYTLVEGDPPSYTPALGPDGYELVLVFATASLVVAAVAARASELLVGHRQWVWPYTRVIRLRSVEFTRVSLCLWSLITAGILSWYLQDAVPDLQEVFGPSPFLPGDRARWVEAVDILAFFAGKVAMLPICLLGVPLARSSALWRLAGLSYEEAVTYHRWLGAIAVVLTTLHTIGYLVVWWQPGRMDGHVVAGLHSLYERLFSQEHGIRGLNPLCEGRICESVSNLAGLIAWAAGVVLALLSFERVRRSRYLYFIQFHQLHYVFFGFTCAHWSFATWYMLPPAVFYAADIALRSRGSYACDGATGRVHGDAAATPSMITLVLPAPPIAAAAASSGCPHLARQAARATDNSPASVCASLEADGSTTAGGTASGTSALEAADPWAGTTCYLQVKAISPLRAVGGWTHPFTVAGSVAVDPAADQPARRALLVHIAPERAWTLSLARRVAKAGGGADAHLDGVAVTGPLPAPPHLNHLAHAALSGRPVLLIGAGSGVTPCLALLRMLASQPMPAGARVRFVVVARSLAVLETLDGFMLPSGADGVAGFEWLSAELHLTRTLPPGSAGVVDAPAAGAPHSFRGAFRLRALPSGALAAHAAPFGLVAPPGKVPSSPGHVRRAFELDEISSLLGATAGFLCVTWPLLCAPSEEAAPWADKPTVVSGLGSLLLAWLGALAGAHLAIAVADAAASFARRRPPTLPSVGATAFLDGNAAQGGRPPALSVPLASNGARPSMAACLAAFDTPGDMVVAAGGPEVLLASLDAELRPRRVRLTRLTHPM